MNSKDFAIGVLSVTATILFVGLLLVNAYRPAPAYGGGQNATGGDYLVTTTQFDATTELLCILDAGAEQMNIYAFNPVAGRMNLIRSLDVRWRPPAPPKPTGRGADRGKGR